MPKVGMPKESFINLQAAKTSFYFRSLINVLITAFFSKEFYILCKQEVQSTFQVIRVTPLNLNMRHYNLCF